MAWAISTARRAGGARPGGFLGADKILGQIAHGAERRRVGLRPEGRVPVRAGAPLFAQEQSVTPIGKVTSGGFGPTVQAPVAIGYLPAELADPGRRVFTEVRGQRVAVTLAPLPFVPARFKRA